MESMYPVAFFDALRVKIREDGVVRVKAVYLALGVLGAVFPATTLQTRIVHLIRNSLDFASWKDRKALAAAIKPIYTATNADVAEAGLGHRAKNSRPLWVPSAGLGTEPFRFFTFPSVVRRVIYTTNALESVNARLRKIIKTRGCWRRPKTDPLKAEVPLQN